ncbi:hypothetical protein HJC23_002208 [Cyclotella cryptica]|uniref:TFIID subunit TAF5 NTD2 domain-containing protein n=1 Tax=Cyclotella cryptica TaxID=29204 RepID=A0ABD3Q7C6_9STRA|eukprot:CCRYP_008245-RA/>CCRYP_008245-RA protein AED:0.13 eAED:0.13 QI:0/-1/0/1/-1/1/1/0/1066
MTTATKKSASSKSNEKGSASETPPSANSDEEAIVLSYLRKHGLSDAAAQLTKILEQRQEEEGESGAKKRKIENKIPAIDYDVSEDADADSTKNGERPLGMGYDVDSAPSVALWGVGCPSLKDKTGVRDEARGYVEGFTGLITWILSLGDDPANLAGFVDDTDNCGNDHDDDESDAQDGTEEEEGGDAEENTQTAPVENEQDDHVSNMECDQDKVEHQDIASNASNENAQERRTNHQPHSGLATLVQHALLAESDEHSPTLQLPSLTNNISTLIPSSAALRQHYDPLVMPPSTKPELLSLSFPLMVHTYCELLSCNMERTARAFLETYRHLYEPTYPDAIADMDKCSSTSLLVELNDAVTDQNAVQNEIRSINVQIANGEKKREELEKSLADFKEREKQRQQQQQQQPMSTKQVSSRIQEQENNLAVIDATLSSLAQRLTELNTNNTLLQTKLSSFPFLRRVRALKWNVTISTSSFHALEGYAASRSESIVMTSLLMNRCHLIVERRDPLPFCPVAVLEDVKDKNGGKETVKWAAPVHPAVRAIEEGEDVQGVDGNAPHQALARSILVHSESLPYPKYRLDGNDKDAEAKSAVEFNRALLVNGFRRLEALELKRDYEAGMFNSDEQESKNHQNVADPLSPSVLLGALCCSSEADVGAGAPWAESNVGITSASICPPDGRKVAVGCDDAAVRIWSLDRPGNTDSSKDGSSAASSALGEPSMVLLGHKNGFPVFDVDWTRNGRTLLSAGGDGSIRLWDTEAVGPYGRLSNVSLQKGDARGAKKNGPTSISSTGLDIPGSKAEPMVEIGGAALSVYRGHAPSTPIWSVSSAPCGYYFASAGSDYTARIWCTERCSPLRVLSGHISPSVNCVTWHPNCNYVVTASDDKTCRMWDIQTGKCVRILAGSSRGLNVVRVSPSGKYVAGAGYDSIVRIWDLSNGRLVNELRPSNSQESSFSEGMIHSISYSSCGSALAVGGEDCTVRIWDVRGAACHLSDPGYFAATKGPHATSSVSDGLTNAVTTTQLQRTHVNETVRPGMRVPTCMFMTNNISVLDLKYTKRNLLLTVGNYST